MKKSIFILIPVLASFAIYAQNSIYQKNLINDYTNNTITEVKEKAIAPNFTVTFTDGRVANLYDTLNAGNIVMLDFFSTT